MEVRIVLDTNLLVASRWKRSSSSARILDLCIAGELKAVYTSQIKDENLFILGKVKPPKDYLDKVLKFYGKSVKLEAGEKITACPDPSDNRFLEAAVAGNADYVITNDHHLLDLKEYEGIKIIRPGTFTRMLA
ncbi:MAG: putative toxin-antitoxin system toxin component, PIN family [Candidatus Altiarchaeota archaeon]